ncbi:leucine-rich repeat protein [Perkinsela sp. CCAP 1560/4]|nr:leucine-rich repeat protein [Perkinsela sp. CCAP 1560/4]KNH09048.1 leucine-rich repeat protein [Perkinsela sp. CCAP 1560/4]|eukprot:KNH06792.1 leucine-rich repeat protein [Perkinsela sp. CCAP 1560/4]
MIILDTIALGFYCTTLAVDRSLGKLEYSCMNDQQLMEFLIAKANNKKIFCDSKGNFEDVCDWDDVECKDSSVIVIGWNREWEVVDLLEGTIELDWLPPELIKVNLSDQYMSGTLNTGLLPVNIEKVYLGCNRLHGTLDMTALPTSVTIFHVDCNKFEGPLNLLELPPKLKELELDENAIVVRILKIDLPSTIESYAFDGNQIDKLVDLHGKEIPIALL